MTDAHMLAQMKQRELAVIGLAHLDAVAEYFNDRAPRGNDSLESLHEWQDKIKELREWIFEESRIA